MPLATYPLIAWGAAANINGWSSAGTPVITTGQTDPFGGTDAYLVNDNDAGVAEGKTTTVTSVVGSTCLVVVCAKAGTATNSAFQLRDNTAGAYRIQGNLAWSGGVPTLTCSTGTAIGTVSLGNSWYAAVATGTWVTGATAQLEVYGASATASATGTTTWYVRNLVLFGYVDRANSWSRPRDGSEFRQGPSGTEESWVIGPDELFRCHARWIGKAPVNDYTVRSGWVGENEMAGLNVGLKAMIEAGWQKNDMLWVPDRSACTTYQTGYLTEPTGQDDVTLEPNGPYRTFPVALRGTAPFTAD